MFLLLALVVGVFAIDGSDVVLNENSPRVFYCLQKPASAKTTALRSKKILKAMPIDRLCQYGPAVKRPKDEPADCYNDVDESAEACDEKKRFLVSSS